MIIKQYIDLIETKTLRTTPNVRATLDLGEVSPDTAGDLHELRMKGHQALTMILGTNEELEEIVKILSGLHKSRHKNDSHLNEQD